MQSKEDENLLKTDVSVFTSILRKEWLIKRRRTTIIFGFFMFFVGIDYSAVVLSMWFFIKELIKTDNPKLYYSIGMSCLSLGSIIASVGFSRYIDRSRNIKSYTISVLLVMVAGNLLYTISTSVWFPIIGRFASGFGDSVTAGMSGELCRVYPLEELIVVVSKMQALMAIGFVIGPGTSALFKNIEFRIGKWVLNETNFIGIFMAVIFFLFAFVVYFGASDLSKEYDMKAERKKEKTDTDKSSECLWNLKDIVCNLDLMLVVISSTFINFSAVVMDLVIPILTSHQFNWNLWINSIILTCAAVSFIIMMFVCFPHFIKLVSNNHHLFLLLVSFGVVAPVLLMLAEVTHINFFSVQIILITIATLFSNFHGFQGLGLSKVLLSEIVPSHSLSFCEGVRNGVCRIGGVIGFFSAAFVQGNMKLASPIIIFMNVSLLFILVIRYRRRTFQ